VKSVRRVAEGQTTKLLASDEIKALPTAPELTNGVVDAGKTAKVWSDKATAAAKALLKELIEVADRDVRIEAAASAKDAFTAVDRELDLQRKAIERSLGRRIHDSEASLKSAASGEVGEALAKAGTDLLNEAKTGLESRADALANAAEKTDLRSKAEAYQRGIDAGRAAAIDQVLRTSRSGSGVRSDVTCFVEVPETNGAGEAGASGSPPASEIRCSEPGLLLGGATVSTVTLSGSPAFYRSRTIRVSARVTESMRSGKLKDGSVRVALSSGYLDLGLGGVPLVVGVPIEIDVHTDRWFYPTYADGKFWNSREPQKVEALSSLRKDFPDKISLVSRGHGSRLLITVEVSREDQATQTLTTEIAVLNERWKVESGTIFAVSALEDEELVLQDKPGGAVGATEVVGVRKSGRFEPKTGLFISLIPRNYEWFGISFGIHSSSGEAISYYFGPSIRLLGLGGQAVASFSAGLVGDRVRDFPGIDCSGEAQACTETGNDARTGRLAYRNSWYAGLSLGFRFDLTAGQKP